MIYKILGFVLIAVGIFCFMMSGSIIFSNIDKPVQTKEVKCYDSYQNEIIGQTCLEKKEYYLADVSIFLFSTVISITSGFITLALGDDRKC
jgi:hypothetical protein